MDHAREAATPCRNCGAVPPYGARYCAQCGQESALHPPTFGEFVHEFIGHYVALEGALWRTLGLLLVRPGRLTLEYLQGRRRKYVLPLRLYLTISFLFFVTMKVISSAGTDASAVAQAPRKMELPAPSGCGTPGHADCTLAQRWVESRREAARKNPAAFAQNLDAKALGLAPYTMFLLLPMFAWIMQLAWRNRRMTYGEHFVFSLHLHAFWFIDLLAMNVVRDAAASVMLLLVPVYAIAAMHTVYGGRWLAAIARGVLALALYGAVLAAALAALMVTIISSLG